MEHDSDYSEFVKKLIDAVREHQCIYDKKHASYFNKIERERAWCEIADVLGQSVDDCQKRWKLLREKLAKELKKRDRALACGERFQSDWTCFEKIVFIEDHIAPRKKLEKYPFFLAPIDFQEKFTHSTSDASNHSVSSHKLTSEYPELKEQHEEEHNNLASYHQSAKRLCQRKLANSPMTEMDLSNKNNNSTKETTVLEDSKIKREPMVEIDDISAERDFHEMDTVEEKMSARSYSSIANMPNDNGISREQQTVKRLQLKRFDVQQTMGLTCNTNSHQHHNGLDPSDVQMKSKYSTPKKLANDNEDCDKLFGKMVTAMLKDIPIEEDKDDVKLHIMQMLIRAKRGHMSSFN